LKAVNVVSSASETDEETKAKNARLISTNLKPEISNVKKPKKV